MARLSPDSTDAASIPDKYMFVVFSMAITGVVTVFKWDDLLPGRRDFTNLTVLPIRIRTIFLTKLLALVAFEILFALDINVVSSIMFPIIVMEERGPIGATFHFMGAHALSVVAASAFAFFFFLALVGVLMSLLPNHLFRRVSRCFQFASLVCLSMMLFLGPKVASLLDSFDQGDAPFLTLLPPVWFLGLYQQLHGQASGAFYSLSAISLDALAVVVVASLLCYGLSYRRHFMQVPETRIAARQGPGRIKCLLLRLVDRWLLKNSVEQACFRFALTMLARSSKHCLLLSGYLAIGLAVALQSFLGSGTGHSGINAEVLSVPLSIIFFLLSGFRFVFDLPSERRANWLFRITSVESYDAGRGVAKKLMMGSASVVLLLFCLPLYAWFFGVKVAAAHIGFALVLSWFLTEILLLRFYKIPFTCSYLPGKSNMVLVCALYLAGFLLFSFGMAAFECWMMQEPVRVLVFLGVACAVWAGVALCRSELLTEPERITFEEEPEPTVQTLNLIH